MKCRVLGAFAVVVSTLTLEVAFGATFHGFGAPWDYTPRAVSDDGAVIVGGTPLREHGHAFVWNRDLDIIDLGVLGSDPNGTSGYGVRTYGEPRVEQDAV